MLHLKDSIVKCLIGYLLYHFLAVLKRLLWFCYFIGYFRVQLLNLACDFGLNALPLLGLMYGKLNNYVINTVIVMLQPSENVGFYKGWSVVQ